MSFSERQQHCLEAMGIVPWVLKSEPYAVPPAEAETVKLVPETASVLIADGIGTRVTEQPGIIAPASTTASISPAIAIRPMPMAIEALKLWLPSQTLGQLMVRSQVQSFVGQAEAPLLVVVDSIKFATPVQPPASPFSAEAAQLFDLMMRAITVTLGQRKLCYLASGSDSPDAGNPQHVLDICTPQTKAVLLLVHDWNTLAEPVIDHFRLDQPALPVWRIPHPDLLLEFNQLKRQAWTSLQALQSLINEY